MKTVYGYIRVSTVKQGEGASLGAQKDAIERYALQHNLKIKEWFEEKETAAKQGRPLFDQMMKLVKMKKADGIVMHKIDRSARNLKDWVDLSNLSDQGVDVHFAHESLNMQGRGGRLSADIQAVIAADVIRNLKEETIKGLYERIKQGIYPFCAPVGYLNNGSGKLKTFDPVKGPLVRRAFELYATNRYSFITLSATLRSMGLTTWTGKPIGRSDLTKILNNPFYIGLFRVKSTIYNGKHEPMISASLFRKVQMLLKKNTNQKKTKHEYLYRKLIKCKYCGYSLIAEFQKGQIYYRCHTPGCITKAIRESRIDLSVIKTFKEIELLPFESDVLNECLSEVDQTWTEKQEEQMRGIKIQKVQIEKRLERLTDCYVEGGLDKTTFELRKESLLIDIKEKEGIFKQLSAKNNYLLEKTKNFLELSKSLVKLYQTGNSAEKLELLKTVTSNFSAEGKNLEIATRLPFQLLKKRDNVQECCLLQDKPLSKQVGFVVENKILSPTVINTTNISEPLERAPLSREQLKMLFDIVVELVSELPEDNNERYGV